MNNNGTPNAIFICSKCKLACIAPVGSWIQARRNSDLEPLEQKSKGYISNQTINLVDNSWTFFANYNQCCDELSQYWIEFPLCDSCMSHYISMQCCQLTQLISMNDYLSRFKTPHNVTRQIQDKITKEQIETQSLSQIINLSQPQPFSGGPNSSVRQVQPLIQPTIRPSTFSTSTPSQFKSLMLYKSFHFSFNQQYPTINGLRLSSRTPHKVDKTEVAAGFAQLGQFIIQLAKLFSISLNRIRVGLFLEVKINNEFEEIHYPPFSLTKGNQISRFNERISVLFEEINKIFELKYIKESPIRPPFQINQDKTIGEKPTKISYVLDQSMPSRFTQAMRLLVINFQHIQYLLLKNYVDSVQD